LKHSIKNCGQTPPNKDWLLLTAYKKLPASYPMVLSPTFYNLPFSHKPQYCTIGIP